MEINFVIERVKVNSHFGGEGGSVHFDAISLIIGSENIKLASFLFRLMINWRK